MTPWRTSASVNGVDHWAFAKPGQTQPEQRHVKFEKLEGDTMVERLTWDGPDGKPMLDELSVAEYSFTGIDTSPKLSDSEAMERAAMGAPRRLETEEAD